jgi:hypothetical protein
MKINNLTAEDVKFLKELKHELNTQDNRITANPRFYQIQHNRFVASCDGYGNYFEAVRDGESLGIYTYDDEGLEELKDVLLADYDEEYSEDVEEINSLKLEKLDNDSLNLKCYGGDYEHVYVNAFLTERACKEHIEANRHHYENPVDYLSYGFRNPELEKVLEILSKIEITEEKE